MRNNTRKSEKNQFFHVQKIKNCGIIYTDGG